jgi:hypothetical protein
MNNKITATSTAKNGGRKFKNDVIFIAVLLLASVSLGLFVFLSGEEGDCVVVSVDKQEYGTYMLSQDARVEIRTGEREQNLNVLVIKDGEAYVESASCPDGICSSHRPISREGESIACLPNRVIINVRAQKGDDDFDIIS